MKKEFKPYPWDTVYVLKDGGVVDKLVIKNMHTENWDVHYRAEGEWKSTSLVYETEQEAKQALAVELQKSLLENKKKGEEIEQRIIELLK